MKQVGILDYGAGNLASIRQAIEICDCKPVFVRTVEELQGLSHLILPGVGHYKAAMEILEKSHILPDLSRIVFEEQIPTLGICLGMQLFAARGTEGGGCTGLNWIPGTIERLYPRDKQERVPHIGWNDVRFLNRSVLFESIPNYSNFYFAHSYYLETDSPAVVIGETSHCGSFPSIISKDNLVGVQFHPEKSQKEGLRFLSNFLKWNGKNLC